MDQYERRAWAKRDRLQPEAVLGLRLATYEIRVLTYIKDGNVPAVDDDVRAILLALPRLPQMPQRSIRSLMAASFALGADRLASLIRESPSADRLLPLTTALDWEWGGNPELRSKSGRSRKTWDVNSRRFWEQLSNEKASER